MRDPKRVKLVWKLLYDFWSTCPDMRFFQLISYLEREYVKWSGEKGYVQNVQILKVHGGEEAMVYLENTQKIDLFYLEDDRFIEFLQDKLYKPRKEG